MPARSYIFDVPYFIFRCVRNHQHIYVTFCGIVSIEIHLSSRCSCWILYRLMCIEKKNLHIQIYIAFDSTYKNYIYCSSRMFMRYSNATESIYIMHLTTGKFWWHIEHVLGFAVLKIVNIHTTVTTKYVLGHIILTNDFLAVFEKGSLII